MTNESPKEIAEVMQQNQTVCPTTEKSPVVSNHTGYGHEGVKTSNMMTRGQA